MKNDVKIRSAIMGDMYDINRIYNESVMQSTSSFDLEPVPLEDRQRWFLTHGDAYPIIVAVIENKIVGWGSLSCFALKQGYRFTVEDSIYIDGEYKRRGIGTLILENLIESAKKRKYHTIVAIISSENDISIKFHEKMGFQISGCLREVGFKFDRWLDVVYMQYFL